MPLSPPVTDNKQLTLSLDTDGYYISMAAGPDAGIMAEAGPTSLCYFPHYICPSQRRTRYAGQRENPSQAIENAALAAMNSSRDVGQGVVKTVLVGPSPPTHTPSHLGTAARPRQRPMGKGLIWHGWRWLAWR